MSDERIDIIIKEINYWKKSKLLPDVYCNFLLALYTNGEGVPKEQGTKLRSIILVFLHALLLPISIIIVYLTQMNSILQIILLITLILISFMMYKLFSKVKDRYYYLSLGILLMLLLLIIVFISNLYFGN